MRILIDLVRPSRGPFLMALTSAAGGGTSAPALQGLVGLFRPLGHRWASDQPNLRQRRIAVLSQRLGRTPASSGGESEQGEDRRVRSDRPVLQPTAEALRQHHQRMAEWRRSMELQAVRERTTLDERQAASDLLPESPSGGIEFNKGAVTAVPATPYAETVAETVVEEEPLPFSNGQSSVGSSRSPQGLLDRLAGLRMSSGSIQLRIAGAQLGTSTTQRVFVEHPQEAFALAEALSRGHFQGKLVELPCCVWSQDEMVRALEQLLAHPSVLEGSITPQHWIMDHSLHRALSEEKLEKVIDSGKD